MKRIVTGTVAAAAIVAGLAGFSAAQANEVGSASTSLAATAEGYTKALLSGDGDALLGYLSPFCSDTEQGELVYAADKVAAKAKGATLDVTGVSVDGDRGSVSSYKLSAAPAALRKLFAAADDGTFPWVLDGGTWKFQGTCGAAPSEASGAVTSAVTIS